MLISSLNTSLTCVICKEKDHNAINYINIGDHLAKMCYLVIFVKPTNIVATLTFESQPTFRQDKENKLEE
jgi:hypothetical protein